MTLRLVRMTVAILLLAGTAACGLPGGGNPSPCEDPVDDEPTTFDVSSSDLGDPDVVEGCIDQASDRDTFDLTGQDVGTGVLSIQCFGAAGVAEFDTPASTAFVACTPDGSTIFNHQEETFTDVIVQAQSGSTGGEYRLEITVS